MDKRKATIANNCKINLVIVVSESSKWTYNVIFKNFQTFQMTRLTGLSTNLPPQKNSLLLDRSPCDGTLMSDQIFWDALQWEGGCLSRLWETLFYYHRAQISPPALNSLHSTSSPGTRGRCCRARRKSSIRRRHPSVLSQWEGEQS